MKYTLKPLKGDSFEVEMDPENTVLELKKKVAELKPDFPVEQQKLIYSGKILNDENLLKEFEIKGFIVVMITKAAPPPSESAGASRPASAAPEASGTAAPAAAATPAPAAAAPTAAGGRALPSIITDLRNNPRFGELARTVAANPQVLARMLAALRRTHPDLSTAIQENLEGFLQMLREEVLGPAAAAPQGGGGAGAPQGGSGGAPNPAVLAQLLQQVPPEMRNNPQFRQIAAMVAQNPAMLAQLMQDPQIMQQMQGGGGGEDDGGPEPMQIPLTEADNQAIERLAAMGFDRNMAAQAYLACEKNEELAANFLMDGGVMDEDMGGD
mmetsp:Transcript_64828/g.154766  ORF Transcript_64828/g.154766 Transcript_64828/m.154766 type:complete len:326 (+) Transcript_64828:138-1115(+)